ncbi:MAG TPA: NRDE family protein [Steroidobacteraceae bacterium]|nr:NRDE family protein [Steroidobacteraceae bacterium]
MCLLVLAWAAHPRYRLVVAANRDEYHERPAAPLGRWPEPPGILAGRDLRAAGTWLGIDAARRFGVVTNFRELQRPRAQAPSRGGLIPQYLAGAHGARQFFARLEASGPEYSGFNLLLGDGDSLWYGSNRATPFARELRPGVYGLSNELLDTPWPKLLRVKARFRQWLAQTDATAAGLFALLADRTQSAPGDTALPTGGLPREWERILSAPFVVHPTYGTRCSTVLLLEPDGALHLAERRFDSAGEPAGESEFRLNARAWP